MRAGGAPLESGRYIGRIKRSLGAQCVPVGERQQHARLESVHVLRRHRGENGPAVSAGETQPPCLLAYAGDEPPEALAVGERGARGARGEDIGEQLPLIDEGYAICRAERCSTVRARIDALARIGHAAQSVAALGLVCKADHIRRKGSELTHHIRRLARREQAGAPGEERRGEGHREMIAIHTRVQYVGARWERTRKAVHVTQELGHEDGRTGAVRDYRVGGVMRNQRQRGQRSTSCGAQ